jgi:hypothetical protein
MPALNSGLFSMRQTAPGRRQTSPKGRNRVMLPVSVSAGNGLWGFELLLCLLA